YQTLGLKVETADGDPISRTTSSRLCAPISSLSTEPGVGAKPRWATLLAQPPTAREPKAAPTRRNGTVRRMDVFLGSIERGCTTCRGGGPGSTEGLRDE